MSIVVAVVGKKDIHLACDSQVTYGDDHKSFSSTDKIIKCGTNYIGIVGDASFDQIFLDYYRSLKKKPLLNNKTNIFKFSLEFHVQLRDRYFINEDHTSEDVDDVVSSKMEYIIANKYGLFKIFENRYIEEVLNYCAIGSGTPYALGSLYESELVGKNPEESAKLAIKVAKHFDLYCGGESRYFKVQLTK